MAYAAGPFFEINQLFAKASIFALYYRIFSSDPTFKRWTAVLVVLQVCWFIATFFCLIFLCVPVSKWWDILDEENGWCMNDAALLAAEETINSCIDFVIVGLSIFMVKKLHMKKSTKWKLGMIFTLGGLSGVVGFVKIIEVYAVPDTNGSKAIQTLQFLDVLTNCICSRQRRMYPTLFGTSFKWLPVSFAAVHQSTRTLCISMAAAGGV